MSGKRLITVAVTALAMVASGAVLAQPASGASDTTVFLLSGDTGDPISGGQSRVFQPPGSGFGGLAYSPSAIGLGVDSPSIISPWVFEIGAPVGQSLTAGTTYLNAGRGFGSDTNPGFDVSGNGVACNEVQSSFTVLDVAIDPVTGHLDRFAATFEQHCDGRTAAARGAIYYHSTVPFVVGANLSLTGPATAPMLSSISLAGVLSDGENPVPAATLALSREDDSGVTELPDVTTASDGTFTLLDTIGMTNATYTATFRGTADLQALTASWQVQAVKSPGTLTVNAPATGTRGARYTVSGTVTSAGATVAAASLTVSRKDIAGTRAFAVSTNTAGGYSFTDTPVVGGPVTFTVVWVGDALRAPLTGRKSVTIARYATAMSIKVSATKYKYGATCTITAHLGSTYNSRYVTVYSRPLGTSVIAPGTRLVTARVSSLGNLKVTYTMTRKTTFTAVFGGDYRYASATRSVTPTVISRVRLTMTGYSGKSGGAYLYRHGTNVHFRSTVAPGRPHGCEAFVAQGYRSGRWVTVTRTSCGRLDGVSTAHMHFQSTAPRGARFRVRGSVVADAYSAAGVSAWRYFTFT